MSTDESSVIDADEFTVSRTIFIAAPIEKVWAAITEAEHIAKWFPEHATLSPVEVGTTGIFGWADYGDFPVRIEELDPPHTIAYRWGNSSATASTLESGESTVFRFTLEPADAGTQLTVIESGFDAFRDPAASMESNRGGWNSELDELVAYLEGSA
ncbi:SRPBCC family protein [soil metagenome]